ncbi:MAG: MFS transporter [Pseudomonadota bacterium]
MAGRPLAVSTSDRMRGIAISIAIITVVGIGISIGGPLLGLVLEARGYSEGQIGTNTALAGVAVLLVTPFVAIWAQRIGTVRTCILMALLASLSFALFYPMESLTAWAVLRIVFHGAITILFVISEFWINALAPDHRRGVIMGVYATVLSLGFAVGPLVLGFTGSAGFLPFAIGAVLMAAALPPLLIGGRAAPDIPKGDKTDFWPFLFAAPLATTAAFVFGAAETAGFTFLALYGVSVGFEEQQAVMLVAFLALGGVFAHIPLGLLADRMNRRLLLVICAGIGMVGGIAIPFAKDSFALLGAIVLAWGGLTAGLYTIGLTHLGARFKGGELASANAVFIFNYGLGMLFGPLLCGFAMEHMGPTGYPISVAGLFALYLLLALFRIARDRRSKPSAAT